MRLKEITVAIALGLSLSSQVFAYDPSLAVPVASDQPLSLRTMGSFAFGGSVDTRADKTTFHGDHGYAQYYIPSHSRHLPIVMWHGVGQSGKTYETTPDGREGFQVLLPRHDWSIYIVDQPRRGRAGYSNAPKAPSDVPTTSNEADLWEAFRIGPWTKGKEAQVFKDSAFPLSASAVEQFFRQQTPNTAEEPRTEQFYQFMSNAAKALFESTGDVILMTHSRSGYYGWDMAMTSDKVKAVISFEPGACAFPESDPADEIQITNALVRRNSTPAPVADSRWNRLLQIPILIIYGDNIAKTPQENSFNGELWRVSQLRAKQFVEKINRHGGDATFISLPEMGVHGNTHAAFADTNNTEVLRIVEDFLKSKKLDVYDNPHMGPNWPKAIDFSMPLSDDRATHW